MLAHDDRIIAVMMREKDDPGPDQSGRKQSPKNPRIRVPQDQRQFRQPSRHPAHRHDPMLERWGIGPGPQQRAWRATANQATGASGGPSEFPLMQGDHTILVDSAQLISYRTKSDTTAVPAFYKDVVSKNGWTAVAVQLPFIYLPPPLSGL